MSAKGETVPLILVAEDNPTNRLLLTRPLEKAGYEVACAADGVEAEALADKLCPDLILMDISMPKQDGLETCAILRTRPATRNTPIIFVTSYSDTDSMLRAFDAGGTDYVQKPFRYQEILARVVVHLRLKSAEIELREKNRELEQLTRELADLSRTDSLTKLLNRRTWDAEIEQEHARFARHGHPYSIVMVDVDCFKAYNDQFGHQAGDQCLQRVAESIQQTCRKVDTVGRYGGEEFVILSPETSCERAQNLAERIRKAVWALGMQHPASTAATRVTVSVGVATSRQGDTWERVLRKADDALYIAKRAGRNMIFASSMRGVSDLPDQAGELLKPEDDDSPQIASEHDDTLRVLVVDDEPTNRLLAKACLEKEGYHVSEAEDGVEALQCVEESPIDVIIMDVMMPHMDGIECTKKLRIHPNAHDLPIIMLSALAKNEDILAGLNAGADEYLTKPIRPTELALRVRSMARLRREHADLLQSYEMRAQQMRLLTGLVEFCQRISSIHQVEAAAQECTSTAAGLLGCQRVALLMLDEDGNRLELCSSIGLPSDVIELVRVGQGDALCRQALSKSRAVLINDASQAGRFCDLGDAALFHSFPFLALPLTSGEHTLGVIALTQREPRLPFLSHELEFLELAAKITAGTMHAIRHRQARDQASDSIMIALAKLAEHRDNDTGMHLDRVTHYARLLAQALRDREPFSRQIDDLFLHDLQRTVPLHDIGKVAIPDDILLFPGRLSDEQMNIMRTHAVVGASIIQSLMETAPGVHWLNMGADIARHHHEWFDGNGYPDGLRGDDIPLAARLAAVADVYDALTTKRVYKDAMSHDRAASIILDSSGTQFDPAVVDAFLQCETQFAQLASDLADNLPADAQSAPTQEPAHAGAGSNEAAGSG